MTKKKSYKKPEVKQVKLVSEEAVLSACKTEAGLDGRDARDCDTAPCKKGAYGS